MRFARLQCDSERVPAELGELAGQELDFLQLDYARPRVAVVDGDVPVELRGCALGFADATRALVKTLYLEPDFRVITSAGWSDAYGCVERTANVLVEGGCGEAPMSAIRGSNLLPILEMLEAEGVDLRNAKTGASWRELRDPILAADLQLGGGPIATALAENARVIIAGCYDRAAPAMGFAVATFGLSWGDYDRLAAAAVAARAAEWRNWQEPAEWGVASRPPTSWAELNESGGVTVNGFQARESSTAALERWLRSGNIGDLSEESADVHVDTSATTVRPTASWQVSVEGQRGANTDDCWRLEVLYQAGYSAEAMVELAPDAAPGLQQHLADIANAHLQPENDNAGLLTVAPLQTLTDSGVSWLHLAYQSKSRKACAYFLEQTVRLLAAHAPHVRLASGVPRIHVHCGLWPARVPRDAVDIAVETRLAREWI
jgi:hypothetical protein